MKSNQYHIQLGGWSIHPSTNQISNHKHSFFLKPRLMRLLVIMLEQPDKVFIKEELMEAVWEDRIVTDNLLTKSISELRQLIDNKLPGILIIETIRSVGYKLTCKQNITFYQSTYTNPSTFKPQKRQSLSIKKQVILIAGTLGFILLLGRILWQSDTRPKATPAYTVNHKPITSKIGMEWQAAISPEGANIVYSWRKNQSQASKLYVRHINAASARRLTTKQAKFELNPVWSPDGQKIAFLRVVKKGLYQLQLIPLAGSAEQTLSALSFYTILPSLQWDAQHNQIIFSGKKTQNDPYAIYTFDLKLHQLNQLSQPDPSWYGDHFPSLLPDGRLAFVRSSYGMSLLNPEASGSSDIILMNTQTKRQQKLQQVNLQLTGFTFSKPLNQFVLSLAEHEGYHYQFFTLKLDGTLSPIASIDDIHPTNLLAHPSSPYIVYEAWGSTLDIYQLQDSLLAPYLFSTHWDWHPRFSANGEKVAFLSARNGSTQVWICNKNQPELAMPVSTFQSKSVNWIALSPDATTVLLQGYINQVEGIYLLHIQSQQMELIKEGSVRYAFPEYAPDGQHIYYTSNHSGDWEIWRCNIQGDNETMITQNGGYKGLIQSIQKDTFLIYTTFKKGGLWKKNLRSGEIEEVFAEAFTFDKMNFSATSKGIYYYKWKKGQCIFNFYDFESRASTAIKSLDGIVPEIPSLSVTPSGEAFISLTQKIEADLIKLELR